MSDDMETQMVQHRTQRQLSGRHVMAAAGSILAVFAFGMPAHGQKAVGEHQVILEAEKDDRPLKFESEADARKAFVQVLPELSSADFAKRRRASEQIIQCEQFTLAMIEEALQDKNLSIEGRTRLLSAGRMKFFNTPRAALGFQFGGHVRDRAVVGKTFPQFPSHRLLEEGDMIVGADGYVIAGPSGQRLLQAIIISHDPKEIIKLVIRRGAQKLNVDVPLGAFVDLEQGGGGGAVWLGPDRLVPAWKVRSAARLGAVSEPVRVDVPEGGWGPSEDQVRAKELKERINDMDRLEIAGGGMPRVVQTGGEMEDFMVINGAALRQQIVMIGGRPQAWPAGRLGLMDANFDLPGVSPQDELAQLLQSRMVYSRRADELNKRINDPGATPDVANDARKELAEAERLVRIINKQMDAIQAEVDEVRAAKERGDKQSAADASPDERH